MQPMLVLILCRIQSKFRYHGGMLTCFHAGLVNALKLLQPIKDKYSGVTYADLFQLASATAIEVLFYLFCPIARLF